MSEQKDEFEEYCFDEIRHFSEYIASDDVTKEGLKEAEDSIYTLGKAFKKYQEIKAKNVCKNCVHLKAATEYRDYKCLEVDDISNEGLYLDEDVAIKFSCNRFQYAT